MKVLWLCNVEFIDENIKTTGGWLQSMAEALVKSGEVKIVNVTISAKKNIQNEVAGIKQYVIQTSAKGVIAPDVLCESIKKIIDIENPDLVHIWGTESLWLSVATKGFIKKPFLLDIQGLLFAYADFYYGNMRFKDVLNSIHLKELLMPWRTLLGKQSAFVKRGKIELQGLKKVQYISYQSEWVRNQLTFVNPKAKYYPTRIMLRKEFIDCKSWNKPSHRNDPVVFTTASGAIPYKGIDVVLKIIVELKNFYPNVKLRIAGQMFIGNRLLDGYSVYLKKMIRKLDVADNVVLLGPIDANRIVHELQNANVAIIPSFVETYCLAFAESMIVGTPTVCAYSGAMPEFAVDKKEALFYNPHDYRQAAALIKKLIEDENLAKMISNNARSRRMKENAPELVLSTQLDIYKKVMEDCMAG